VSEQFDPAYELNRTQKGRDVLARSLAKMLKKKGAEGFNTRADVVNKVWIIKQLFPFST